MKKTILILNLIFSAASLFAANTDIRLNSIGYRTDSQKKASVKTSSAALFYVVSDPAGVTALAGTTTLFGANSDTGETIYFADFSSVTSAGTYYLDIPGTGRSFSFSIGNHVFDPAFYTVFRGYYLWRCGTEVTGEHYYNGVTNTYTHTACHMNDGWLDYVGGGHVKKTGTKGWHDAGDYNKYVTNANVTFGVLGKAWEYLKPNIESVVFNLPAAPAAYPEYLRELKWETDWLFTMQAAGGRVYHKLSALDFSNDWCMPQDNTENRYYVPYSTAATADFVAMMAQAYRLFLPYDATYANQCLAAARVSYGRITTSPDNVNVGADQTGFSTGGYGTSDEDDRVWAAAEMWEATGESIFLTDFENRANAMGSKITGMDWGDVRNLGMFTYYRSVRAGKSASLMNAIRTATLNAANTYVSTANSHGYARALGTQYWWGVNGALARTTFTLYMAHYMSPLEDYVNTANEVLNNVFGRNYFCRSMVTGLGYNAAMNPHDRRSANDGISQPWPGYLVGGSPGTNDTCPSCSVGGKDPVLYAMPAGLPPAQYWADHVDSYASNEIAINWNSALVFALAWLKDAPVFPTPTITGTPPTATASPTITETHTITPTWTITQTHTITPTPTITPTEIYNMLEITSHYTYPNPSAGEPVKFRFSNMGFIKKMKIRIFSYSSRKMGEAVAENINTGVHHEVIWSPDYIRLGNGIYYYIMEAQGINTPAVKKIGTFIILGSQK